MCSEDTDLQEDYEFKNKFRKFEGEQKQNERKRTFKKKLSTMISQIVMPNHLVTALNSHTQQTSQELILDVDMEPWTYHRDSTTVFFLQIKKQFESDAWMSHF